jgi:hypothetical protein
MSKWFRLYDDTINDPKILKLSDKLFRIWIGVLCAASKNDGKLPPTDDLALMIRIKPEKMVEALEALVNAGLVDRDGPILSPHNWNGRQYKSDVSTERVKRFRNGKRNVSETPPDTDTDTDTEKKKDAAPEGAQVVSILPAPDKVYFDQAAQYLGNNGRSLAAQLLKSKGNNIPAAHQALLAAVQKSNPREYIGAIIRGRGSTVEDLRARGEAW